MPDAIDQNAAPAANENAAPAAGSEAPAGVGADEQVVPPAADAAAPAAQTPEQKAAADLLAAAKTPEEKAAAEAAVKAAETPAIEYQDFTLPEGAQIDDVIMGEFKQLGQDNKFTQDQMQAILDLQQKLNQRTVETVKATREGWRKDSENDKEFGGAKFEQSKAAIAKARDAFASQPLVELFDNYGLSDHPEVLRHFYKLGQKISEDSATTTGNSTVQTEEPSAAEILYGKPKTK